MISQTSQKSGTAAGNMLRLTKAQWGCKAPYLPKLRILGAFMDVRFNELVPR